MAEIRSLVMKLGSGRPVGLTFAARTLACAGIHCDAAGNTGAKEI
ncbi:MAG: hypothetical protein ACYC0P_09430 [Thiobacillus sp.]